MKPTPDMPLIEFLTDVYAPKFLKDSAYTVQRRAVKKLGEHLGRAAIVADVPAAAENAALSLSYRGTYLALWRLAAELDVLAIDKTHLAQRRTTPLSMPRKPSKEWSRPEATMPLLDFVLAFYAGSNHGRMKRPGRGAVRQMRRGCWAMAKCLGRSPLVTDLTAANIDATLKFLASADVPPTQQKVIHALMLALWRFAADYELVPIDDEYRRKRHRVLASRHVSACFDLSDAADTLWGFCKQVYFPRNLRLRSKSTERGYELALRKFGEYLGRQPTLADLTDDTVVAWTKQMLDVENLSVYSIRERMGRVLSVWNWAARRRKTTGVEEFPTVRRPEAPDPVPIALTAEQLRRLFTAAAKLPGRICGVPGADWWQAWLAFIYNTAERYGAAKVLRWEWVELETGVVSIPANVRKGKRKHAVYHLWPETVALLRKIVDPTRELVFPTDFDLATYYNRYKRLLADAGLPTGRKYKTHCLRATHATMRMVLGGDATAALMHSDPATTRKHYIDVRHLPADKTKLPICWESETPAVATAPAKRRAVMAWPTPAG